MDVHQVKESNRSLKAVASCRISVAINFIRQLLTQLVWFDGFDTLTTGKLTMSGAGIPLTLSLSKGRSNGSTSMS